MLRMVSFFAGIGGFDLGLSHVARVVGQVEVDPLCRRVLEARFGHCEPWRWDDITTLRPADVPKAEVWAGGFPCQGISAAGTGRGLEDERSGLWRAWAKLIAARRPRYVLLENSPRLRTRGLDEVLLDLRDAGYDARWLRLSAWDVGAWHWRERLWLLATQAGAWAAPALWGAPLEAGMNLPADGLMVDGDVHALLPVTAGKPPANAFRRGLALPTATASSYGTNKGGAGGRGDDHSARPGLESLARRGALPTATSSDAASAGNRGGAAHPGTSLSDVFLRGALPTPAARDERSGKSSIEQPWRDGSPCLAEVMQGVLNPAWIEPFMGFPIGWTDPTPNALLGSLLLPEAWVDGSWVALAPPPVVAPREVAHRRARVRALGNAVVPLCVARAWRLLVPG